LAHLVDWAHASPDAWPVPSTSEEEEEEEEVGGRGTTSAVEVRGRSRRVKRAFDLIVGGALVALLSPVLLVVAYLVRRDGGPAFYRQMRVGYRGRPLEMLKFRSMSLNNGDDSALRSLVQRELSGELGDGDGGSFKLEKVEHDPRITPIGRRLRAWSIDELPQLLNVVRGDMSLVGPRPALDWEVEMFPPEYRVRTEAMPGVTGLWQVNGRSKVNTLRMLQYDIDYLRRQSMWIDLKILALTIPTLLRGDGAR